MKALALLIALPLTAHAGSWFEFEAGVGVGLFHTQDGLWYQQAEPHSIDITSPVFSLGLTGSVIERAKWGVNWHADYVYLGHSGASCDCTSDRNYDSNRHRVLAYNDATANFQGSGTTQGIALTLEPYYRYRGFRFGIEGGAFLYRAPWHESVYGSPGGAVSLSSSNGIRHGAVIGASVSKDPWSLAYRHYVMIWNAGNPPLATGADTLELKWRF